ELGQTEVVRLRAGQPLEAADDVVAQPANRAAEEARQARRNRRRQLREVVVQEAQRLGRGDALADAKRAVVGRLQDLDRRAARAPPRGAGRRRSCRPPTCRRPPRSPAGTNTARARALRRRTRACRCRPGPPGTRTRAGLGGRGRETRRDPARNPWVGHHSIAASTGADLCPPTRAPGAPVGYHEARPPADLSTFLDVSPETASAPGAITRRFVSWTVRHGKLLWAIALLLAIPATWRTTTLYRHLRSEI